MTNDPKKRGLGRGLDALFRDVKKEEATLQQKKAAAPATSASAAAPVSAPAAPAAPSSPASAAAPVRRADEMVKTAEPASPAGPPRRLPVDRLKPGKYQPRTHFDENALTQLAESIAAHGVVQPLLVRPIEGMMYEIIAGERRWRAAQKARVHDVPVVVRDLTDKEAMEIALIENLQREDLSAIEEAEGYERLLQEFGHTQDMLSQQLGKSRSHVANTLRLLKLPVPVRKMVQSGTLSAGHARNLVGLKEAEQLAAVIVKRGLSVRQTEKMVQQLDGGAQKKPAALRTKGFAQKDVDILALEQKMSTILGTKVLVDGEGSSGKLVLEYKNLDQLDDFIARLSRAPQRH
ncbi:MAG: ParB/RepB/Spo0J family partition protein [Bdellovibrionales bacterium]|jgi:ParB family chromosome partitioning protein|nr:ParB/RepB/Spo0J family partition protein [Bdellovibrionales bacterium]